MTRTEPPHDAARGRAPARRAKAVLISAIGLHLVAETALTPFLPQLFDRLYGIDDPGATGLYLWICRIVGLAALPLWGLAARRWPLHRLVLAGLCGSAVLDILLGLAPSYAAYTAVSTAVVATNCALLLAYPAFIAEHGDADTAGAERARLAGICSIVVVFHLSTVVATLVGAGVLALPEPRIGISAFAVLDAVLAVLTYRVLGRQGAAPAAERGSSLATAPGAGHDAVASEVVAAAHLPADAAPAADGRGPASAAGRSATATSARAADANATDGTEGTTRTTRGTRRTGRLAVLAYVALIGIAFDFSVNIARPFFTEFADSLGTDGAGSAVLFFLPSVAALAVLPAARRCHDLLGERLLPLSLAVGAAGLAWQAISSSLTGLAAGRLLFGIGLGLGQVAVELRMFRATGTEGPAFTGVETARAVGLLAAPLAATAAVSHDLALPLALAAGVQVAGMALAAKRLRRAAPAPAAAPANPAHPAHPAPTSATAKDPVPAAAGGRTRALASAAPAPDHATAGTASDPALVPHDTELRDEPYDDELRDDELRDEPHDAEPQDAVPYHAEPHDTVRPTVPALAGDRHAAPQDGAFASAAYSEEIHR
ncbi:hypothetical protein [Streptomyces sp. NPDC048639]|uniref:hypothetical protein n=1 Tax=Streptomyces sp. NPDC048639 TaxID=3365581 RepID=UPI0037108322